MKEQLVIIGASGHGKVVADIARKVGYTDIVFLDDNPAVSKCGEYRVIGNSSMINELDADFVVAIGNANIRKRFHDRLLKEKKNIVTLIHPNAVIGERVSIGRGTVIMAGVVINPDAEIGQGCIINTGRVCR